MRKSKRQLPEISYPTGAELKAIVGRRLRQRRDELGWDQASMAYAIEQPPAGYSKVERGLKSIAVEKLVIAALRSGVSVDWLCGLTDKQKPDWKKPWGTG